MILGVSQEKTEASAPAAAAVCPDEFYEYKGKKKAPKTQKQRVQRLRQAFNDLEKVAVNMGNEDTFKYVLASVLHTTKECQDMNATTNNDAAYNEVLPLPPAQRVGSKSSHAKADGTNHSRLSASSTASKAKKKTRKKKKADTPLHCSRCHILANDYKVQVNYTNHSIEKC